MFTIKFRTGDGFRTVIKEAESFTKRAIFGALGIACVALGCAASAKTVGVNEVPIPPAAPATHCDPLHLIPGCGGIVSTALAKPFQDLATFLNSDLAGAAALATAIPGLQDTNGAACWTMLESAGAVFKAHPVPLTFQGATDLEALRLLAMEANAICTNSACTQVFSDMSNIAGAVSPVPLSIPSLNAICAKVPAIGGVAASPIAIISAPATQATPTPPAIVPLPNAVAPILPTAPVTK